MKTPRRASTGAFDCSEWARRYFGPALDMIELASEPVASSE